MVLAGARDHCVAAATSALRATGLEPGAVWVAEPGSVPTGATCHFGRAARQVLGQDLGAVVLDLFSGIDSDAIGAVLGAVAGGGLVLVLAPPQETWSEFLDPLRSGLAVAPFTERDVGRRFVDRFLTRLCDDDGVTIVAVHERPPDVTALAPAPRSAPSLRASAWTDDQAEAVDALLDMAVAARPRPVVLISDRGRGKSSALGLAAGRVLANDLAVEVVVTAPSKAAAGPVFERSREVFGERGPVHLSPDRLLAEPRPDSLLLVDEAAALPVPVLTRLLTSHPRIAFATTVHGYEGTGRGFAVRFRRVLDERAKGWRELRLVEPIRWAAGDPVERFASDALLMGALPVPLSEVASATPESCEVEHIEDRSVLAADERTLSELFGLLVLAHYRTTPADLRRLLDAPNLSVSLLLHAGRVVAAALVAAEGGLDEETVRAIEVGRMRPRGHMLPEVLASHLGRREGATLPGARVVRIAVHPGLQRRGLGTTLLEAVADRARGSGCALLGSGFGATLGLLGFWRRAGFRPVRLGVRRGAASGIRSAIVLRPLDERGTPLFRDLAFRFRDQLPHLLTDTFRDLEPDLALDLLASPSPLPPLDLDAEDRADLYACAFGPRIYDVVVGPVWGLVRYALADPELRCLLGEPARRLLLLKVLQKRRWSEVVAELGFSGNHEAMRAFRAALVPLVLAVGGEQARRAQRGFA
jgi:tRNA(Met) cytidine acetyltransferase